MALNRNKILYLDGIRGIAAFLVFFHHFLLVFYTSTFNCSVPLQHLPGNLEIKYSHSVWSVLSNGNFCVNIFFVLSGFVLSRNYFHTHSFDTILSGMHRRYLRLNIPIAFTIIVVYIMMQAGLFFNAPVARITHSEWWFRDMWSVKVSVEQLLAMMFYKTIFMGDGSLNTVFWTMSIEFFGSLFVFSFLALTHSIRNKGFILILILIYCYFTDAGNTVTFALGITLCYAEQWKMGKNKYTATIISFILLALGLILGSFPSTNDKTGTLFEHLDHTLLEYTQWYHQVGAYFLVLAFVLSPALQKIVSLKLFTFLGYISFFLYLSHVVVIGSFGSYLFLHIYKQIGYNKAVAVVFLTSACVIFLISAIMTKYVDAPGIRFAKYVYSKWFKKESPVTISTIPATNNSE